MRMIRRITVFCSSIVLCLLVGVDTYTVNTGAITDMNCSEQIISSSVTCAEVVNTVNTVSEIVEVDINERRIYTEDNEETISKEEARLENVSTATETIDMVSKDVNKVDDDKDSRIFLLSISNNKVEVEEEPSMYDGLEQKYVDKLEEALNMTEQDDDYDINVVSISGKDREMLEALVFGEAGGEGFVGQCLVAQCLRDTMSRMGSTDTAKVIKTFKYAGSTKNGTSQSCKDAVSFIFDKGGYVVKQRIIYFYAYKRVKGKWHETQDFVLQWGGHRFFDDSGWE